MASEAAEARAVLVCLGSRPEENAALWQWASRCFFEPQRDMLSLLHARTDTMQIMARGSADASAANSHRAAKPLTRTRLSPPPAPRCRR